MSTTYPTQTDMMRDIESGKWADRHNVHHSLIPYGYRERSPLETLRKIRQTCKSLGKYKQTFWMRDISGTPQQIRTNQRANYIHWAGCWAWTGWDSTSSQRYCNPLYCHKKYPAITDRKRRKWLIKQTYDIPFWNDTRYGWAFGIDRNPAGDFRRYHFGTWESDGDYHDIRKFARTMKTINNWGHSYSKIGECFPVKGNTIKKQTHRYAPDFEPPTNPYRNCSDSTQR